MIQKKGPIRIGMVGAGSWAAEVAECLKDMRGVQLTAVYNRTIERAQQLADRYRIPDVFHDVAGLCRSPDVDAVMVLTHESAHAGPVLSALDAGKPVFVEKPMADTVDAARQMVDRSRQTGLILQPGHLLRFEKRCQAAKARIDQAGPVRAIRCFQHRPKRLYSTYCRPHIAFSLMIHHLDLCRWFVNCPVARVDCRERFFIEPEYPSSVWAIVEFGNGAVATLQSGWVFETDSPSFSEDGIEIIAEKERIAIEFAREGYEARTPTGVDRPELSYHTALRLELEYWLDCIESNRQPTLITADDGLQAVALAESVVNCGKQMRRPDEVQPACQPPPR